MAPLHMHLSNINAIDKNIVASSEPHSSTHASNIAALKKIDHKILSFAFKDILVSFILHTSTKYTTFKRKHDTTCSFSKGCVSHIVLLVLWNKVL